jgi:hypothetical protein
VKSLHQRTHPEAVPGCFACRIASVQVSPSAMPSRQSAHAKGTLLKDREWTRDMAAYRRLRQEGHQPPRIDGCAELEKAAENPWDIKVGHTDWSPEAMKQASDLLGSDPLQPITAPKRTGTEDA